jgi:hypothetical protein
LHRIIGSVVLVSRIFAVLAAMMFVAAFSLIVLAPATMNLAQGLHELDAELPYRLQHFGAHVIGAKMWVRVVVPVLVRPVWMVPGFLALLFAGVAASFGSPTHSSRSTRTRP